MARWPVLVMSCALLAAQEKPAAREKPTGEKAASEKAPADKPGLKTQRPSAAQEPDLPEEDETLTGDKQYTFNPLQASKEVQIGNFYFKKGSFRAAAQRFREATRWNPGDGDAWLRLGETYEKLKDSKAAKEAFAKYLEVVPDARNASQIRKKIGK